MFSRTKWLLSISGLIILFYWKILLTNQFSLLTAAEGVNQAYAWLTFWVLSVRHGTLPMWDPNTFSGHSFIGEMQTAAFYPLNLLLAMVPFNKDGLLSPRLYNEFFVLAHLLGAVFMFALIREMQLSRLAALLGSLCFSLGGFVSRALWPHLLQSSIWTPLILLFLLRSLRARRRSRVILHACMSGLCLGMSILAGGLHVVFLQVILVATGTIFYVFSQRAGRSLVQVAGRAALIVFAFSVSGLLAGAVQLFPSAEYSALSERFLGTVVLPATEKIPYTYLSDKLWPHGLVSVIFPHAYGGVGTAQGEGWTPYIGVFPFFAALIGIFGRWENIWVRYLTGLAVGACLYSMADMSPLHGILYALTPFLWMAREATRSLFLAQFALCILAAFGVDLLFRWEAIHIFSRVKSACKWIAIAAFALLLIPALFRNIELGAWNALSLILILASVGLLVRIIAKPAASGLTVLIIALTFFDLSAFDWSAANKIEAKRGHGDFFELLLSCRGPVNFLRSRPAPFRVAFEGPASPNIGDIYGIPFTYGGGVTLTLDYARLLPLSDLLNVRYVIKPSSVNSQAAIYRDNAWIIEEKQGAFPRAWVVHSVLEASSQDMAFRLTGDPAVNLRHVAVVSARSVRLPVSPVSPTDSQDQVLFRSYDPNRIIVDVTAMRPGLLVTSELFYPGWRASVNGQAVPLIRADGALRAVKVDRGTSRITFQYAPRSVAAGGAITICTFGLVLAWRFSRARTLWRVRGRGFTGRRGTLGIAGRESDAVPT